MNYDESIAYLESLGQFGIRLGMERIQQLLFVLGHPENQVKTIHVAGTNGKGSVTTMIAAILAEQGCGWENSLPRTLSVITSGFRSMKKIFRMKTSRKF